MAMNMAIVHDSDRYEFVRGIGFGTFSVARLMIDKVTKEAVVVKYIERGETIDEHVEREIVNHRCLRHPNIVRFKELVLTPTHLAIVMEYASGGSLFDLISNQGRFGEDEARFYFRQLISGVGYCHEMEVCHRDLKLENVLLDGSRGSRLKICDFGYSKSSVYHSEPNSTVGSLDYVPPEVLMVNEYDGKLADVWSCGVMLYVMLTGLYPFQLNSDDEGANGCWRETVLRILSVEYTIPEGANLSPECRDLISRIFVWEPESRITIPEIMRHDWFVGNDAMSNRIEELDRPTQSLHTVMEIISEATVTAAARSSNALSLLSDTLDTDEEDTDEDLSADSEVDIDCNGERVSARMDLNRRSVVRSSSSSQSF